MTQITARELADMRAIADDFFPDTCTIQTRTESVDALGGITQVYVSTYTNVPCRLDPKSGNELVVNAATEAKIEWMLNIPYNQAISVEDRIVHSGKTYEVVSVVDTQSYSTIRRAKLIRRN